MRRDFWARRFRDIGVRTYGRSLAWARPARGVLAGGAASGLVNQNSDLWYGCRLLKCKEKIGDLSFEAAR